jgi:hypothetical protein
MAMIGLWVFHLYATEARKEHGERCEWWKGESELDRCLRYKYWALKGNRRQMPQYELINICANRYARRFGGIETVGQWNALCRRIAKKGGFGFSSVKHTVFEYDDERDPIVFENEFREYALTDRPFISARYKRLVAQQEERRREEAERRRAEIWAEVLETKDELRLIRKAIATTKTALKEMYA